MSQTKKSSPTWIPFLIMAVVGTLLLKGEKPLIDTLKFTVGISLFLFILSNISWIIKKFINDKTGNNTW